MVADGRVRTVQASVDQFANNDSATQLRAKMAATKTHYEAKLSDALADPKLFNNINLEAIQDCYARMVCVPDVKALMDEFWGRAGKGPNGIGSERHLSVGRATQKSSKKQAAQSA